MSALTEILERLGIRDVERMLGLNPPYPPVSVQVDRESLSLVRLKRRRGKPPLLEAVQVRPLDGDAVPASIFHTGPTTPVDLTARMRHLFEASGTRPGRVSLVVPDNLAKISLLRLPERPASARQMDELVRAQMRRAIPFRVDEARISYQILPSVGRDVVVLVVLMRRALVEQYEHALESIGARVGLVDLCTTNLINLCRAQIVEAAKGGGDVGILNCEAHYFSLAVVRDDNLIFFRCKTYAHAENAAVAPRGTLRREISNSLSYYREKLAGKGVGMLFVRSAAAPVEEIVEQLSTLGIPRVEPLDPLLGLRLAAGAQPDRPQAQRVAPAIGAAAGRG